MHGFANEVVTRPWPRRYGVAIGLVIGGFLGHSLLLPGDAHHPLRLLVPAIIGSRWYGGTYPALLATGLSGLPTGLSGWQMATSLPIFISETVISVGGLVMLGALISTARARSQQAPVAASASPKLPPVPLIPLQATTGMELWQSFQNLVGLKVALDQAAIFTITDAQGVIQYVNDRFCQVAQYQPEELIGKTHRVVNSGYHSKEFFQTFWATISQGQVWQGEIQNRAKDGSLYWMDTTVVPMLDQAGQIQQYLAIRFDITQRKQAELALQQLNERLESLVEERTARLQQSLSFEATLKRITDKVRDSLDEAQILQTAVAELAAGLGAKSCHAALYDLEQGTSLIRYEFNPSIFATQGQVSAMSEEPEIHRVLLQGDYLQFCNLEQHPIRGRVTMLACPMQDAQTVVGSLWLVIDKEYAFREPEIRLVQQVANQCAIALRQAQLYDQAQAEVKMLEEVNWLKDDFLSTVSHELRTPVSNMRMSIHMLELILQRLPQDAPQLAKGQQYLQILKQECEREISLINDLLDLQRLEAGKRSLTPETIAIEPWLVQLLQPFENRLRDRNLHLQLQFAAELPPLTTDVPTLERVLAELMNNACKYTPPGQAIAIQVNATPTTLQFRVRNTGVEITAAEQARIFDKFYRVPHADPWKQGGTGLGLALVQRLVAHLNGAIAVKSGAGQTEFKVEIPQG